MPAAPRSRDWSWAALGASVLVAAIALVAELRRPLNPDAAFLLHSARRMLGGARLYTDILEINPPLILWLNLPIAWLSRATGLPDAAVLRAAVLGLVIGSALACAALAARLPGAARSIRRAVIAAVVFVLLPITDGMFAQREHLLLALLLPLVLLTALRVAGGSASAAGAAGVGLAGAVAVALKPQYGAAWLLLVGYRLWAGPRGSRRLVPEDLAVLALGVAYPLLVLALTPDYFTLVAGAARDYLAYGSRPLRYVLVDDSPAIWFYVALAAWLALDAERRRSAVPGALAAAGLGAVAAIGAQHKGWSYHYLPLTGLAFLLAVATMWPVTAADRLSPPIGFGRWAARGGYGILVALFAGAMVVLNVRRAFGPLDPREQRQVAVREAVRREQGARTLLVLSSQLRDGFPLANDTGLRWVGGYPNMWLSLVYYRSNEGPSGQAALRAPAAMAPGERAAFQRIARDIESGPDVLVVESPALNQRRTEFPGGFDYLRYFGQDSACAAALAGYRRTAEVDGMWVMRRGSS